MKTLLRTQNPQTRVAAKIVAITCLSLSLSLPLLARAEGPSELPTADPASVGMSAERLERIDGALQGFIDRNEVAGTVALIARKGKVVYFKAQGYRDVEQEAPMTTDVVFRIASMTKPITSVAAMMLHEEGRYLISEPVSRFLPEFSDVRVAEQTTDEDFFVGTPYKLVEPRRPITIRHLLTHTAGLSNVYRAPIQPELIKHYLPTKEGETIADFVRVQAALPLNYHPGEHWEYSRATCVVGRLVEVVSEQPLDRFFQERIFEPLGMTDSHFYLPTEKVGRFAASYTPDENGKIVLKEAPTPESRFVGDSGTYFMGSGGMVSTAADYYKFCQMLLNGGDYNGQRILSEQTVELMRQNHTGDLPIWLRGPGGGFGLGFGVVTDAGAAGTPASVGTFSWGGAYCTVFWIDPVEEMVGVLMTQVRPYTHLTIRQTFLNLAYQALED